MTVPDNGAEKRRVSFADLGVRSLSAIVLIPLALLDVWAGGTWFQMFAACLGILMAYEIQRITASDSDLRFALSTIAVIAAAWVPVLEGNGLAIVILSAIWALANVLVGKDGDVWHRLSVGYVALPVLALVMLRNSPADGLQAVIFILLLVWCADTLAYFAGRIIGGPKLAPRLSPKKTWAGLGGAVAGATLVAIGFQVYRQGNVVIPLVIIAAVFAFVEQAGDILESSMKRRFGVKDSGNLIPGHGGVLDRIDGLLAVAVAAALLGYLRDPVSPATGLLSW